MRSTRLVILIVFSLMVSPAGLRAADHPPPELSYPKPLLSKLGLDARDVVKNRDEFKTDRIHRMWMAHVHSAIADIDTEKEKRLINIHASMRYIKDRIDNAHLNGDIDRQTFSAQSAELMRWFRKAHQRVLGEQAVAALFSEAAKKEMTGVIDTGNGLGFPIQNPETTVEMIKEALDARTIEKIGRFYQEHARELRDIKKIYKNPPADVPKEQIKKDMRRIKKELSAAYRQYCRKLLTDEAFKLIFDVKEESKAIPEAAVEQPSVSFPPAIAGSVVTHTFSIQNAGDARLNILGVHTQ
ncbi:MAG: hypothetical protein KGY61_01910 [Desulfobacterales bacterium]|nr:hypothetical protein [Desulfobacterales bacterium]